MLYTNNIFEEKKKKQKEICALSFHTDYFSTKWLFIRETYTERKKTDNNDDDNNNKIGVRNTLTTSHRQTC